MWNTQLGQTGEGCSDSFRLSYSCGQSSFTTLLFVAFSVTAKPPATNAGHNLMDVKR